MLSPKHSTPQIPLKTTHFSPSYFQHSNPLLPHLLLGQLQLPSQWAWAISHLDVVYLHVLVPSQPHHDTAMRQTILKQIWSLPPKTLL